MRSPTISSAGSSMQRRSCSTVYVTLNWLIITPLGGPVVPEV